MASEDVFNAAVQIVHAMPKEGPVKTSVADKLAFYSLYKQATIGPCNVAKPGFWNVVEGYKWQAWKDLGNLSKEEARRAYVEKMKRKIDLVNETHDVGEWMERDGQTTEALRHLFELIDRPLKLPEQTHSETSDTSAELVETPLNEEKEAVVDHEKEDELYYKTEGDLRRHMNNSRLDALCSDGEYCDAPDQPTHAYNNSNNRSCQVVATRRRRQTPPSNGQPIQAISNQIAELTRQVSRLVSASENRQGILIQLLNSVTCHLKEQNSHRQKLSWKAVFLLFVWPFVVHYFLKYRKVIFMLPKLLPQIIQGYLDN